MDIACPQCSTSYTLDPQLLPPGGAPVRCTRCGHTFTAVPPTAPQRHVTAPYGAVAAEAAAHPGRSSTVEYGSGAAPARGATQQMGVVTAGPPRSGTQQMGAVAAEAPRSGTQQMGAVGSAAPVPPRTPTQAMGVVSPALPVARTGTQSFGAARASTQTLGAVELPEGSTAPRTPTQAFGAVPAHAGAGGEGQAVQAGTPRAQTFLFPAAPQGPRAGEATEPAQATVLPEDVSPEALLPEASLPTPVAEPEATIEAAPRGRVALPSEPLPLPVPTATTREVMRQAGLAPESDSRRGLLWVAILAVVALVGWGVWRAVASSGPQVPPEAQLAREEAGRLLRRDDGASREKALGQLEALVAAQPTYVEARADLVQALALALSDVRVEAALHEEEREGLLREVARLEKAQTPGDWQNRVNALKEQATGADRRAAPLRKEARALERKLTQALKALPAISEETPPALIPHLVRAQALAEAVAGSVQVLALTERYRQHGGSDGWDTVAYAEYLLHSPVGPSGAARAREALGSLKQQDASFLRVYVLDARLALLQREPAAARSNLDAVLTLNPEHSLARLLLAQVRQEQQAADALVP